MLIFDEVSYKYPNSRQLALSGVSFSVNSGRCVALMGANGSGKSTLVRLANGLFDAQQGHVVLSSTRSIDPIVKLPTSKHSDLRTLRSHVAVVTQNPDLQILATTVEQDVAFGPENLGVKPADIAQRVRDALAAVGLVGCEQREPHTLSGGEKQRLVLAGALAMQPDYLILDEPTSMLDAKARAEVHTIIEQLRCSGHGILLVTHNLTEARMADEVIVLDAGCIAQQFPVAELEAHYNVLVDLGVVTPSVSCQPLQSAGQQGAVTPAKNAPGEPVSPNLQSPLLTAEQLTYVYDDGTYASVPVFTNFNLQLYAGKLTLITGQTGTGKSTLLRLLAGLLKPTSGSISMFSKDCHTQAPEPGKVGLVFQEPANQLFAQTVAEDVAFGPANLGLAKTPAQREEAVRKALTTVGLDYEQCSHLNPLNLSGGQARRVAIAGVLALDTPVVLFDEPTAGLDARGIMQLVELLTALLASGKAVAVVSHDAEIFLPLASDIIELNKDFGLRITPGASEDQQ